MPENENENDTIDRPKRNPSKKTNWQKSDKMDHGKKTAFKRRLEEIADEDDDQWEDYK
jgi:hypothetical protein